MDAVSTVGGSTSGRGVHRVLVVVAVMIAMIFAALDQTVVGTAMPRIVGELGGMEHYAWVFTAYMLASTVTVPVYGKLSDLMGRRPLFLLGLVLFLAGSLTSSVSRDMVELIASRGLQGLGAGALLGLAPAILADVFPPAERARWQGVLAAVAGLVLLMGPTAGGWITDAWGWRWIFYVNLPLGALGLLLSILFLPAHQDRRRGAVDFVGAALVVGTLVPLLLALSWGGREHAWASVTVLGLLAVSGVLMALLLRVELRHHAPIIDLSLFRQDLYRTSLLTIFLLNIAMHGALTFVPLFAQGVLGDSATEAGTIMAPLMASFVVSSIVATQILARTGRYRVPILVMLAIGTVGLVLLGRMDAATTRARLVLNLVVTGLGAGGLSSVLVLVAQNAMPHERVGEVTAGSQFFRALAGTVGVALLGALLNALTSGNANVGLTSPEALAESLRGVFLACAGVMSLGLLAAAMLREIPMRSANKDPGAVG